MEIIFLVHHPIWELDILTYRQDSQIHFNSNNDNNLPIIFLEDDLAERLGHHLHYGAVAINSSILFNILNMKELHASPEPQVADRWFSFIYTLLVCELRR